MTTIELSSLRKSYGSADVIHGVDLKIDHGEFCVFVGPSGCGKSTLLRMIAGLEDITQGDLYIDGQRCNEIEPARRGLAMVFQTYALYPHMTVEQNMGFGLRRTGTPKSDVAARVSEAARVLQLEDLMSRKPSQLSGGQRQRVAIGRAIVRDPRAFLFDEPLSNLDAELRVQMRVEIAQLHQRLGSTMIYVTHDQVEAMTMADRIVVLRGGRIEQSGAPLELYNRPINRFVAGFIGSPKMNFIRIEPTSAGGANGISIAGQKLDWATPVGNPGSTPAFELGIRPEHIRSEQRGGDATFLEASVDLVENLGGQTLIYTTLKDGQKMNLLREGQVNVRRGDLLQTYVSSDACHFFTREGLSLGLATT